ncbi:MAG: glycoside hydrolase family 78 protein [Opitutaceae bacterium]
MNAAAVCIASLALILPSVSSRAAALAPPGDLRTEYALNPLGLESSSPRLSWQLTSRRRGARQIAYQILVASSVGALRGGKSDLWDSGRVDSDQSVQVPYRGPPLHSRERCAWTVRVWGADGRPTAYSEPATWEMGLLQPSDWEAEWIGYPAGWTGRALYFRREIQVTKRVARARAYVAGIGYSEFYVNGEKVGDHVLDPGTTDYAKRVLYDTYDVTARLRPGKNAIGAIVGHGWYGLPKLLLQLEITYADGTREIVSTKPDGPGGWGQWHVTCGPILADSIYDGETYDARLEKPDWSRPDLSPKPLKRTDGWADAMMVEPPGGRLVSQQIEPIEVVDTRRCLTVREPKPGIFVFDVGQNIAGWAELKVAGPRGAEVVLRFAETLNPNGTVNQENLRTAAATDRYVLKGGGPETWQPRFTYHGFRFIQVEGYPGKPTLGSIAVKRVRSAVSPNGTFECSSELINRIQRMIRETEANNLYSIPTDCPQRNERMGWLNDLTVRLEESLYNFELPRFYTKFLNDVGDAQRADGAIADTAPYHWPTQPADPVSASYLLMGWFMYRYYGDSAPMADHYEGFKRWVDFLAGVARGYIVPYGRFGDWSPPAAEAVAGSAGAGAIAKATPLEFMSTGFLYYQSELLAKMATVLGKRGDARRYRELAQDVAAAFNAKYWNERVGGYGSNNQACNCFALWLHLVPERNVPRVVANLVADVERHGGHLSTGNLCTKYLMEALTEHGHADLAFRIATQKTYPSWGYMLANGATTLWERWEDLTEGGMNSHDHPMMGSVSAWFYKYLAGIQPAAPGFKRFTVRPYIVRGLTWVRASYRTGYGEIRSEWMNENGVFTLKVGVPVNTSATIGIPDSVGGEITSGGKPVTIAGRAGGFRLVQVGSGDYTFVAR